MSIIKLTPSIYLKGLKYNLSKSNAVDTVSLKVFSASAERVSVAEPVLVTSVVDRSGSMVLLPLVGPSLPAGSFTSSLFKNNSNEVSMSAGGKTSIYGDVIVPSSSEDAFAAGTCRILTFEKTISVTLTKPVTDPYVEIEYKGYTDKIGSKVLPFDGYPLLSQGKSQTSDLNLAKWIRQNKSSQSSEWTNSSEYKDYDKSDFAYLPFVKKIIWNNPIGGPTGKVNLTDSSDIITPWNIGFKGGLIPLATCGSKWYAWHQPLAPFESGWNMGPSALYDLTTFDTDQCISFPPISTGFDRYSCTKTIKKIDDTHYDIYFKGVYSCIYAAKAQYNKSATLWEEWHLGDSNAFVDYINEITVSMMAIEFDGSVNDVSYSLGNEGITTDVINNNILTLPQSELIRSESLYYDNKWTTNMSEIVLSTYKNNKYVIECSVSAQWALDNNIQVNSQTTIQLLDGEYVSRLSGDVETTYSLVNITPPTLETLPEYFDQELTFDPTQVLNLDIDNKMIFAKNRYATLTIRNNDTLEFVHSMGVIKIEMESIEDELYMCFFPRLKLESVMKIKLTDFGDNVYSLKFKDKPLLTVVVQDMLDCFTKKVVAENEPQNIPIVFEVKNIQKVFKNNSFVYQLKLLEKRPVSSWKGVRKYTTDVLEITGSISSGSYIFMNSPTTLSVGNSEDLERRGLRAPNIQKNHQVLVVLEYSYLNGVRMSERIGVLDFDLWDEHLDGFIYSSSKYHDEVNKRIAFVIRTNKQRDCSPVWMSDLLNIDGDVNIKAAIWDLGESQGMSAQEAYELMLENDPL